MTSTLKWEIIGQVRVTSDGAQEITTVGFKITAVDGEHSAEYQNEVDLLPPPPGVNLIQFEKVTEANVIEWVQAALAAKHGETHVKKLQQMLDADIAKKKGPPIEFKPLPWAPAMAAPMMPPPIPQGAQEEIAEEKPQAAKGK